MKMKNTSISLVLFLTIGIITIVSFSLGCTEQEENSSKPVENISLQTEPVANTSESIANTSESAANISQQPEPVENVSSQSGSSGSASSQSGISGGTSPQSESSEDISQQLEPISADKITSIRWLWKGYEHSDKYTLVPNPENYILAFFSDGTCYVKAECNSGNGSYTLEENNLTIDSTAITLMACGPDSMDPEYMELLAGVKSAVIKDGQLILYSSEGDSMFFTNGGQFEQ
ncbi:META domain-containing protein [Methanosarcina sp.]|uniref:META domain-containing protein n=1 Tax=Methanosarcina sp. TaxID=2213 RepID=UPI003C73C915